MNLIDFLDAINQDKLSMPQKLDFFKKAKIFSAEEIIQALNYVKKINDVNNSQSNCIDVCGTGGNKNSRLNTSTIIAFLLACKGIPVLKHGSKGMAGRIGSFDFLDSIGVVASKYDETLFKSIKVDFLFAPFTYGSFKNASEARKEYGKLTFMNILGPLLNPFNPLFQIIGCTEPKYLKTIIEACKLLGKKRAVTYCHNNRDDLFLDESEFEVYLLENSKIKKVNFLLEDFGLTKTKYYELPKDTVEFQIKILNGQLPTEDVYIKHIALNAAMAEFVFNDRSDFVKMVTENINLIQCGVVMQKIKDYVKIQNCDLVLKKIVANKIEHKKYIPKLSLANALKANPGGIIAEYKIKSPSNKQGFRNSGLKLESIIKEYNNCKKVVAISHVTDSVHFGGNPKNIRKIHEQKPVLFKDFIIDASQVIEAESSGADAILLIQKILSDDDIVKLTNLAHSLNLEVMLELEDQKLLKKYEKFKVDVIGLNSRNLSVYKSGSNSFKKIRSIKPIVYESGIINLKDLQDNAGFDGYLIGTAFMNAENIKLKLKELSKEPIVKVCGLRDIAIAKQIDNLNLDLVGVNFISYSKRKVDLAKAKTLCDLVDSTLKVGLFDTASIKHAKEAIKKCKLDFIQITNNVKIESCVNLNIPIIECINLKSEKDLQRVNCSKNQIVIVDGSVSGSGKNTDLSLVKLITRPFIIAGGINANNAKKIMKLNPLCIGIDVASGVEIDNKQSLSKIKKLTSTI